MSIAITSIGAKVSFAFEETKGVRPTAGYKHIPGIKEIPEMNPSPDSLETTSLDNLQYRTYVDGLKDLGGALGFLTNFSQDLYDLYNGSDGISAKWKTSKAAGLQMYLCVDIQGLGESCYISVIPSELGLPPASVNSVMDITLYFTPAGEPEWDEDPEYAE